MAKRIPNELVCSFCLNSVLENDAYWVTVKMHKSIKELKGNEYHTPCCDKKKCLCNDTILRIHREPKNIIKERAKLEKGKLTKKPRKKKPIKKVKK